MTKDFNAWIKPLDSLSGGIVQTMGQFKDNAGTFASYLAFVVAVILILALIVWAFNKIRKG